MIAPKNWFQCYEIIYEKFCSISSSFGLKANVSGFCQFLNISAGKRQKWSMGQWPRAEDLAVIHDKLGFSYRWLVTGVGDPYEEKGKKDAAAPLQEDEASLLQEQLAAATKRIADLEKQHIADLEKIVSLQEELLHAKETGSIAPTAHTKTNAVLRSSHVNEAEDTRFADTCAASAGQSPLERAGKTPHQVG